MINSLVDQLFLICLIGGKNMEYSQLKNIIKDEDRVIFGDDIEKEYLTDGLGLEYGEADVLVFVKNSNEVVS